MASDADQRSDEGGEVTISFCDRSGEIVVITLNHANAPFERDQILAIAKEAMNRLGLRTGKKRRIAKRCDDGALFRSWALRH
jgi:hypothetical protein